MKVIIIIWCLLFIVGKIGAEEARNSEWFEETIDEFLKNAQNTDEATDIQVSTCKISSQQLVATAQATAARVLKGVCNPNEISSRLEGLEGQLGSRLSALMTLLSSVETKLLEQEQEIKRNHRRVMSLLAGIKKSEAGGGSHVIDNSEYIPAYIPSVSHRAEGVIGETEDAAQEQSINSASGYELSGSNKTKSLHGPRAEEMIKYNSTVHIENGKRVFSYYWVVPEISFKLNNWGQKRVLRSNSFYIFPRGYRMFLKVIPRYSSSTMYIHAGLTKGEYDGTLEWPFSYKMRVQVLDQNESKSRAQDLKSRIWDPKVLCSGTNWRKPLVLDNDECVGLGFPHALIQSLEYIWNDRIIIKLTVYMES